MDRYYTLEWGASGIKGASVQLVQSVAVINPIKVIIYSYALPYFITYKV